MQKVCRLIRKMIFLELYFSLMYKVFVMRL